MRKVLKIAKEIALAIFITSTIFPAISNSIVAISSITIWLIINFILDNKAFINFFIKPSWLMYSIYFWLLTNIIYMVTGYDNGINIYITNYIRIGITVIIYLYYYKNKEEKAMKAIIIYSLGIIAVVNMITIYANLKEYNISRMLATGTITEKVGVGSYAYIYGLIFPTLILIAYLIKEIKDNKGFRRIKKGDKNLIICILFILLMIATIYVAEFLTAMILLLLGITLIVLKINDIKKVLKFLGITIICLVICSPLISEAFKILGENTNSYNLKLRAKDLQILFSTGNIENTIDLKERTEVYIKSINTFIKHPFFGGKSANEINMQIGGHSVILDQLAKYGIIGSLPFFLFLYSIYKFTYRTLETEWARNIYFVCLMVFGILITINTALFVATFYMIFVMSPMLLKEIEQKEIKKANNKESIEDENTMDS